MKRVGSIIIGLMMLTEAVVAYANDAGDAALKTRITVSPIYPLAAITAQREGSTIVCFYVDAAGKVVDPMVLSTTHPDFESAALDAAKHTTYAPNPDRNEKNNYTCLKYKFRL